MQLRADTKVRTWFQKKSLKQKLLLSCVTITFIPMIVIVAVFINYTINVTHERQVEQTSAYADQLIQNFTFEIEKAEIMASSLAEFVPLENYLYMDFADDTQAFRYYETAIHPMVAGYNNSKSGIRIRIYHNRDLPNFSVELNNQLDRFVEENFEDNPFVRNTSFWAHLNCYPLQPVLCYFVTVADHVTYHDTACVVSVQLKEKVFHSYFENIATEEDLILVTDRNGTILTSNDETLRSMNVSELDCSAANIDALMDSKEVVLNGEKYLVINRSSDVLCLSMLVSNTVVKRELLQSTLTIFAIGILLTLLSGMMVFFSTKRSMVGIEALIQKMRNPNRSQIHQMAKDVTDETSSDEITQLDTAFTKMMRQIDELMDRIKNDEIRLRDEIITRQQAELQYLQHQINPHYLFNTLESIRMNLVIKNDYETANVIKIFAASIRRYMNMKEQEASLFEEMEFIEKYIFIQNYRNEGKIDYQLEASDSVLRHRILKLLIQPVVENCVIHGYETKTESQQIRVRIVRQEDLIRITVSDNGCGMPEEKLQKLRHYLYNADEGNSVGLRNVYQRMKLAYGEKANLMINSTESVGTEVTLIIPANHN